MSTVIENKNYFKKESEYSWWQGFPSYKQESLSNSGYFQFTRLQLPRPEAGWERAPGSAPSDLSTHQP